MSIPLILWIDLVSLPPCNKHTDIYYLCDVTNLLISLEPVSH